jgi:hypothetical protein
VCLLATFLGAVPACGWRLTRASACVMLAAYAASLSGNLAFMG